MTNAPLIILKGLEGNEPTHFFALQNVLAPHVGAMAFFWTALFFATFTYMVTRHVLMPFLRQRN